MVALRYSRATPILEGREEVGEGEKKGEQGGERSGKQEEGERRRKRKVEAQNERIAGDECRKGFAFGEAIKKNSR
jgi:hypothetical protein